MLNLNDPLSIIIVIAVAMMLPFFAVLMTSFVKLTVVFSLIRNALGVQSIPPNMAVNGLAIILTIYIMAPVGMSAYNSVKNMTINFEDGQSVLNALDVAKEPLRNFLVLHADLKERNFFTGATHDLWPAEQAALVTNQDFIVIVPAFIVSELTKAFEIGFLLYLPFIAIDLIISNILLAMGMMMVSPLTISLPFKLFLFVMINGWVLLIHGLVLTYQ